MSFINDKYYTMNPKVKYLIRALKQFISFFFILAIVICIVILITPEYSFDTIFLSEADGGMFKDGAFFKISALFIVIAALYPAYSYVKKEVFVEGGFEPSRDKIIRVFTEYGYELVSEDSEKATFRLRNSFSRLLKLYEDPITITKDESPLILSGLRKDITRLASRIEFETRVPEEDVVEEISSEE